MMRLTRRDFIAALAASPCFGRAAKPGSIEFPLPEGRSLEAAGQKVSLTVPGLKETVRVCLIADTHATVDDERGAPYVRYSRRMGGTGVPDGGTPRGFPKALEGARKMPADILLLGGDILSFPTEAGVSYLMRELKALPMPWLYISGNHDWHYEGLPGSDRSLRQEWSAKRLTPLYQGANPLFAVKEVKGIRFLAIDDSAYEILPEQLEAFRAQVRSGKPFCMLLHIPIYEPSAPAAPEEYGCGHPRWCGANDPYFKIERRERWSAAGHTQTTLAFCREAAAAKNLLAVLAGHTHCERYSLLAGGRVPEIVAPANISGAFLELTLAGTR